jgi:hypothetical protein
VELLGSVLVHVDGGHRHRLVARDPGKQRFEDQRLDTTGDLVRSGDDVELDRLEMRSAHGRADGDPPAGIAQLVGRDRSGKPDVEPKTVARPTGGDLGDQQVLDVENGYD